MKIFRQRRVPPLFPPPFLCCWREGASSVICTPLLADCTTSLSCRYTLLTLTPQLNEAFYSCAPYYSPISSSTGQENYRLPWLCEGISPENLTSLLNENSAIRRKQSLTPKAKGNSSSYLCVVDRIDFPISPKAKSWSLMNRSRCWLLGDWPPL